LLQVTQHAGKGQTRVAQVPSPVSRPGYLLIANHCSAISAGTEKMVIDLSKKSLVGKARERPDQVWRVLQKMRTDGLIATVSAVMQKLGDPIALGYSSAGIVVACGAGVQEYKPGDRVASNGPHAGVVCVPKNLCARIPDNVTFDSAAFTVISSIGLQGVRLARLGLGDTVLVIGLGLIGQIVVKLLKAQGCRVLATDPDPNKYVLAQTMGADIGRPRLSGDDVFELTRGIGADAVIVSAATKGNDPIELAAAAIRKKGRVVVVGAVGMNLPRQPFYLKEAELVVSCSYGPGRYDPEYEERGHDYPVGHVRWTEQRNMQAVLDLMSAGKLDVSPLITHRFPIEEAEKAYAIIENGSAPYLGIVLNYSESEMEQPRLIQWRAAPQGKTGFGFIGSGGFARAVLLPALAKSPKLHPHIVCSASGLSATFTGERFGFDAATADEMEVYGNPNVHAVFIATRHNLHATQVLRALRAGKHVFVEKPLAITVDEVLEIEAALTHADPQRLLLVGFNRRFSPAAQAVKQFFELHTPLTVYVRFNAGALPPEHWTQNEDVGGGRIIGEACHAIDLATYLTGAVPTRVFAEAIGGRSAPAITDDQCFITLRHANGSISCIGYQAGGDKGYAKERVEIMGGGRLAVIDDFRDVVTSAGGREKHTRGWRQDKGHRAEVDAFAHAITEGDLAPISWEEIRAVSLASILAVRSLREGVPFDIPT
jgi:predicted dehydrogenase/threonine dehydrogenase-like Zn-dependent dehydrogenase